MNQPAEQVTAIDKNLNQQTGVHSRRQLVGQGVIVFIGVVAAAVFLALAGNVWLQQGFAWDEPIMLAVHSLGTPWLDTLMKAVTHAGSAGAALVTGIAAIWLWRHRRRAETVALLICVAGAAAINAVLKRVFARPRPLVFPPLTIELTNSFPSGHTITAVALYGFLAILLWRAGHRVWALLAGVMIPLIGFSRIYLGVHYPSDVLAAIALGILWLMLIFSGLAWYKRRHPPKTAQD